MSGTMTTTVSGGILPTTTMPGRHIAIDTWLEALGLRDYLPFFTAYGGVEDLLYASEAEIRDLGLKNGAHRAKVVSSLRILREKYEKGKSTGSGVFSLQQTRAPTSPIEGPADLPPVPWIASPEKLQQDLQKELSADPSELKSRSWYHGSISRTRAEGLVKEPGDFLVRDSSSKPGDFVLTCWWRGLALHFMVNALVGECAPGSLPTIRYQFEEEAFGSIQELIQFYLTRHKPVTLVSGAVLRTPVSRSWPLSYYDSKYGSLQGSGVGSGFYSSLGIHRRRSGSNGSSPLSSSPTSSPGASPSMKRRGMHKWTGSQPSLLTVDDSELHEHHHHRRSGSRSPSPLERFGSLPVINVIPPGGPGYYVPQNNPEDATAGGGLASATDHPHHQRSGSAPVLTEGSGGTGGEDGGGGFFMSSPSMRMAPAVSESSLSRAPPPKPSRVPSIKYKQKPMVVVRNRDLYDDDDGRDYTDVDQLSGPPSWASAGGGGGGGGGERGFPPPPPLHPPHLSPQPHSSFPLPAPGSSRVTKSHSFQVSSGGGVVGGGGGRESEVYDNFNAVYSKGYQTLPLKSSTSSNSSSSSRNPKKLRRSDVDSSSSSEFRHVVLSSGEDRNDEEGERKNGSRQTYNNSSSRNNNSNNNSSSNISKTSASGPPVGFNTTTTTTAAAAAATAAAVAMGVDAVDGDGCYRTRNQQRLITMPGFNLGSRIHLDAFTSSTIFPSAAENRLLEPAAVMKVKAVLLSSPARALAAHVTKGDLEVLRVAQEDDLGVGVTSGIELSTLPQGDLLREDIIERCQCQRLFVMTSLMTCNSVTERSKMLSQWIKTAGELRARLGNLYAFTSVLEALTSPQVLRLRDTWLILRQQHTADAFLFDTKLKALLKALHEGSSEGSVGGIPLAPSLPHVALPSLAPVVELLQRDLDDLDTVLSWEAAADPGSATAGGLDFLMAHLDAARVVASRTRAYRAAAVAVLARELEEGFLPGARGGAGGGGGGAGGGSSSGGSSSSSGDSVGGRSEELEEVCRTEFQLRLLWGSKGARAPRAERLKKFEQLLMVLSERLEPPGDDGTAV